MKTETETKTFPIALVIGVALVAIGMTLFFIGRIIDSGDHNDFQGDPSGFVAEKCGVPETSVHLVSDPDAEGDGYRTMYYRIDAKGSRYGAAHVVMDSNDVPYEVECL